jgi:hypothetical protein
MDRTEAINVVVQLQAVRDRATHDGERAAAIDRIDRLRSKFGITESDLTARAQRTDDTSGLFGNVFFHRNQVRPRLDAIKEAIDKVERDIGKLDVENRAREWCRFYSELNDIVGPAGGYGGAKAARDKAIKDFYEYQVVHDRKWIFDGGREIDDYGLTQIHDMVVSSLRIRLDVQRSVIERIVSYANKVYWRKRMMTILTEKEGA